MFPRARVPAGAFFLVVLAWSMTAWGDGESWPLRLVWLRGAGADGCPEGAAVARAVSERLGMDVFSDAAPWSTPPRDGARTSFFATPTAS
jgi:hypothetical protein